MKSSHGWCYLWGLLTMVLVCILLEDHCRNMAQLNHILQTEDTLDTLRAQEFHPEQLEEFDSWAKEGTYSLYEYMGAWFLSGEVSQEELEWLITKLWQYKPQEFDAWISYQQAVWEDLVNFPIPRNSLDPSMDISYTDSWNYSRTFGGDRVHEGTDLMASENQRGHYPVLSITDGVVEQIGWLKLGGYRIGIRAPHGGYFYYAHLSDYASNFQIGDDIRAGEVLGFMGDTGYSEVEGTIGMFDVHLHLGIYVNDPSGKEFSINPYWPLKYLEAHRLSYQFQ